MAESVTGIILAVLAGFLLLRGLPGALALLAARGWREVPATIVGSGVQRYAQRVGNEGGMAAMKRATVAYTYEVDGRTYTGTRAAFGAPVGFGAGLGGIAEAQAARHEPGATVTAWIDPANPANSVLRRSAPSSVVMTGLGLVVAVLGVLSL
jgi:hypothetical protein